MVDLQCHKAIVKCFAVPTNNRELRNKDQVGFGRCWIDERRAPLGISTEAFERQRSETFEHRLPRMDEDRIVPLRTVYRQLRVGALWIFIIIIKDIPQRVQSTSVDWAQRE